MKIFGINIGKESKTKAKASGDLATQIKKLGKLIGRVKLVAILLIFLGLISYMMMQVSSLSSVEPTDEQELEATASIKKVRIKPEDIKRIEALKETNVEVKAIIDENRTNPFK